MIEKIEEKSLEEIANILKENNQGKVRTELMRTEKDYIIHKEGEEGFKKVKEKMIELGVDIDFDKLQHRDWEENWKYVLFVVVVKEVLSWTDDDVFQMGIYCPRVSFMLKTLFQYFVSVDIVFANANVYWKKHYSFGEVEPIEINKEERYLIIRNKGFYAHPVMCIFHAGYVVGLAEFVLGRDNVKIEETSCMHRGDHYHEYRLTW